MTTNHATVSQAKTEAAAVAELATSRLVRMDLIDVQDQVRTELDLDELAGLADSMEEHGQLAAIVLRPNPDAEGRFILVAGERRYRAAQLLEWAVIEAKIRLADDEDAARLQLIENIQREELSLADTAAGVARLVDQLGNLRDVAAICGKSVPWVSKHVSAARKLKWPVAKLLEEGRTEDLELILLLNQLADLDFWAIDRMTEEKMPTRKQVKDAIEKAKAEKEADDREAARLEQERKAARAGGQQDLLTKQETPEEKTQRKEAEARQKQERADHDTMSQLADQFSGAAGTDLDGAKARLDALDADTYSRLEKLVAASFHDEWTMGQQDRGNLRAVLARFMHDDVHAYNEDLAAYSLGVSDVPLTLRDLLVEWHHLNNQSR